MALAAWDRLDPKWKRYLAIGGAVALLAVILLPFLQPDSPKLRVGRDDTIRQILTDKDPRSLGVEGLAAELKAMKGEFTTLRRDFEQLQSGQRTSLQQLLAKQQSDIDTALKQTREL
ncbi:MAG: hypothetical protein U1F76_06025 [Candidatus Competibacteraceae bacterium]